MEVRNIAKYKVVLSLPAAHATLKHSFTLSRSIVSHVALSLPEDIELTLAMHYITFALAAAELIGPIVAIPTPDAELDARAYPYAWSVNTWRFSRGNYDYDYSFNIVGPVNDDNPSFEATCSGTVKGLFKPCMLKTYGTYEPTVSANVNIATDPNNSDGRIPKVLVRMQFTDGEG